MIDLKTFAVGIYSLPGVAEACLDAQDEAGVDVPLLLFCCWYGAFFGQLSTDILTDALQSAHRMGAHVIKPLRESRRWMKQQTACDDNWNMLREHIKGVELKAELLLLEALDAAARPETPPATLNAPEAIEKNALYNMQMYLDRAGLPGCPPTCLQIVSAASLRTVQREQLPASA